jgi:hypothetical protein
MIKTYTFGSVITSIIGSAPMPSYTMGPESTKIRYKEPYVSEAQNLKDSGIIPTGIYAGFTPLAIGSDILQLQVDVARGDSVAVVETRLGRYNMTVRASDDINLDFTAYPSFPRLVVLRSEYSLTPTPLSGMTSSQILVVDPTLDDTDADHLNTGDIKICRVTGLAGGGVVNFTIVPATDRNDTGGSLVTQNQVTSSLTQMAWRFEAAPAYDAPSQTYTNTVISFTTTVTQDVEVDLQASITVASGGGAGMYVGMVLDYVSPMSPGTMGSTRLGLGGWGITVGIFSSAKFIFPSVAAGSHTIRLKYISSLGGGGPSEYLGVVHYK